MASKALERNLTALGPLVLPASEKAKFVVNWLQRRLAGRGRKPPAYVPDFTKAFDHFCLHAGAHFAGHHLMSSSSRPRLAAVVHVFWWLSEAAIPNTASPFLPVRLQRTPDLQCHGPLLSAGGAARWCAVPCKH